MSDPVRSPAGLVRRFAGAAEVARASSDAVAGALRATIDRNGRCRIALAGGKTPQVTYEELAAGDAASAVDWTRVDVFFGDERMVPPDDPASNYRMARGALLDRVAIPSDNVRRILGEVGAVEAARRYIEEIGVEPLDLVLLGMGDDGHVASLFPGSSALEAPDAAVVPSEAPVPPHSRVTVSMSVINAAARVIFIVTGESKAKRLRSVFEERASGRRVLPAARVTGHVEWFLDDAAAALLGEDFSP